jgi:hypothetical protein
VVAIKRTPGANLCPHYVRSPENSLWCPHIVPAVGRTVIDGVETTYVGDLMGHDQVKKDPKDKNRIVLSSE